MLSDCLYQHTHEGMPMKVKVIRITQENKRWRVHWQANEDMDVKLVQDDFLRLELSVNMVVMVVKPVPVASRSKA